MVAEGWLTLQQPDTRQATLAAALNRLRRILSSAGQVNSDIGFHNKPQPAKASKENRMPETAFSLVSLAAIAGWLGLAIASPMRSGPVRDAILLASGRLLPILLCVVYVAFLTLYWGSAPGGGFQSLATVQVLFSAPGKMLGGWTHFLAFDLFVGRWMVDDASSGGRSRIPLLPALPATFLFGPLGVLLYLAGRFLMHGRVKPWRNPAA